MTTNRILGEVFYIKDGNVGLGTSSSEYKLDIFGNTQIGRGSITSNNETLLYLNSQRPWRIYQSGENANAHMVLQSMQPGKQWQFQDNLNNTFAFFRSKSSWESIEKNSTWFINSAIGIPYQSISPPTNGLIVSSNVGIGTTLPIYELHVEGSSFITQNVGIGTIVPTHRLHIYSDTSDIHQYESTGILLENSTNGETGIAFRNAPISQQNSSWVIGLNSNQTRLDIAYDAQSNLMNSSAVKMSFMSNGNIGIGTTLALTNFQVEGLSTFGSVYVRDGIQLNPLASSVRNALQVKPARLSQRLLSSQSNITMTMPGYYIAHSSNVQVIINGFMLYHFTSEIANYNLTTSHLNQSTVTQFSIDFTNHLNPGDLVDITVWPNVIEVDSSQGNVFQIINNLDSVWELSKSNIIGFEQFYTKDAYFRQGNLGIGTTQPIYPLDIYTSKTHINNVYFTSNSIGIGTAFPQYELDVKGNITITGNLYKNNELYVSSQWLTPTFTSNIYVLNSNVGIGTSIPLAKLHVIGDTILGNTKVNTFISESIFTSNIQVVGNNYFYNNDTTTLRNRLQVRPIQIKFVAPNNFTTYSTTVEGLWRFESSNVNVYLNGLKMVYISSNMNDYSVSYQHTYNSTNVSIQFDSNVVNYMDAVDIEMWPSYLSDNASNQPGFVLQNITQEINLSSNTYTYSGDYFFTHNPSTSNLSLISLVTNVGIGTSVPSKKLDVYGDINLQNGQVYYNQIPIVSSQWSNISSTSIAVTSSNTSVGIGTNNPFKPLHVDGGIQMSFGPVATVFFNGGDIAVTATGKRYYGFTISWENSSLTAQKTFRLSGQFHMVNSDGTQQGYLEMDSLITPYDNGTDSPKELLSLNANTYNTASILELSYDVIRNSANSIQFRIKWWITTQPFTVYFEGRVFGTQSLGKITFTEIQNSW